MTASPIKIDPEKMTRKVRLLFETSLVKNLSPYKLAPILHVHPTQIYRWYSGDEPKEGSLALIDQGLERIKELPDFLVEGKATWGRSWIHDTPERRRQEKEGRKLDVEIDRFFTELEAKIPPSDRDAVGMTEDAYLGFQNIVTLAQRYHVRLPKII